MVDSSRLLDVFETPLIGGEGEFGCRVPLIVMRYVAIGTNIYVSPPWILPDQVIVWWIGGWTTVASASRTGWRLGLGQRVAGSAAEFSTMEHPFERFFEDGFGEYRLRFPDTGIQGFPIKMLLEPNGRRLTFAFENGGAAAQTIGAILVVSSARPVRAAALNGR